MNIPDKATMYREVNRVLKPGGALAIYDILTGPAGGKACPRDRKELALMLHCEARRPARYSSKGEFVPLDRHQGWRGYLGFHVAP